MRIALYAVQRDICSGCGIYQPHYLRFEVDHIVALADDGRTEEKNLQLLCYYCNRVKGTKGKDRYRLKMAELRADNVATGVMVDEGYAVLTGKRLANTTAAHPLIWNVQPPAGVGSNLVPAETAVPTRSWALSLSKLADPFGQYVRL